MRSIWAFSPISVVKQMAQRGRRATIAAVERMCLFFLLALILISSVQPATAQSRFTAQQLRDLCNSAEVSRQNACNAYISGVRQTMDVFKNSLKDRLRYCIPPATTNREVKEKFLEWVGRNTAETQSAVSGVMRSIQEAYSCRKPGGERLEF